MGSAMQRDPTHAADGEPLSERERPIDELIVGCNQPELDAADG
jgi:hypothetical protein